MELQYRIISTEKSFKIETREKSKSKAKKNLSQDSSPAPLVNKPPTSKEKIKKKTVCRTKSDTVEPYMVRLKNQGRGIAIKASEIHKSHDVDVRRVIIF